jgi:hypothetical protein
MENELIRVTVLADKGADIIEFLHKPTDTDFLWRSPQGVRNPATFVGGPGAEAGAQQIPLSGSWPTTTTTLTAGGRRWWCDLCLEISDLVDLMYEAVFLGRPDALRGLSIRRYDRIVRR